MPEPLANAYFKALNIIVERDKEIAKLEHERDLWKGMYLHHDDECCIAEHLFDCGDLHSTIASLRKQLQHEIDNRIKLATSC